jgi:hypothetical protein
MNDDKSDANMSGGGSGDAPARDALARRPYRPPTLTPLGTMSGDTQATGGGIPG